jgi:L-histidine N-alpha-methyltransferase
VKPLGQMVTAYDDPAGVTAAFNMNMLARINRELGADFDLRQFEHVARYNEEAQRIEMHLRSKLYQIVSIKRADLIVDFVPNETICTEACHKFLPEQIFTIARTSGFQVEAQWIDQEWPFAENLLVAV